MAREHKHIKIHDSGITGQRPNFVLQEKFYFFVQSVVDTNTGDLVLHTDLPLTDEEIKNLFNKVKVN